MPPAGTVTILLVEDDRLLRKAGERALARRGFRVVTAASGDEALRSVAAAVPDLILLDLVMPGLHGYEVLRRLKGTETTAAVPVVILTNLGQDSDVQKALDAGAAAYAIKSNMGLDDLVELVRKVLFIPESPRGT